MMNGEREAQGNRHERRKQNALGLQNSQVPVFIEMLSLLPHALQAQLFGDNFGIWCSLSEASLIGTASDVVLKHGSFIPGDWHILGVLDAFPDPKPEPVDGQEPLQPLDEIIAAAAGTVVGTVAAQVAPAARELLGRPRGAFGVTPLLIFREVTA